MTGADIAVVILSAAVVVVGLVSAFWAGQATASRRRRPRPAAGAEAEVRTPESGGNVVVPYRGKGGPQG